MEKEKKTAITKEKLISACEKLIAASSDPMSVTSRQIAAESGLQAAMINYCFGSREKLIYEVFYRKYQNALADASVMEIVSSSMSPKDKLKALHFMIASFLVTNYKLTKAITNFVLFERDLSKESFSFGLVKEHFGGKVDDVYCRIIAYELSTMMQLVVFRYEDIREHMGLDLTDPAALKSYIDMRIDLLLP